MGLNQQPEFSQSNRKVRGLIPESSSGGSLWPCLWPPGYWTEFNSRKTLDKLHWQVNLVWKMLPPEIVELCLFYKQASGFLRVNLCTVALAFCWLQAHESGGSCQVTATSGWGRSSPSQWEVFRRTVSEGLCHIKAKLPFKWFRNTLIQDQESAHIFDRVKED